MTFDLCHFMNNKIAIKQIAKTNEENINLFFQVNANKFTTTDRCDRYVAKTQKDYGIFSVRIYFIFDANEI